MACIGGQKMVKMVGKSMAKLGGQKDGNHLDGMQYQSPATSYYHSDVEQTLHGHDDNECIKAVV